MLGKARGRVRDKVVVEILGQRVFCFFCLGFFSFRGCSFDNRQTASLLLTKISLVQHADYSSELLNGWRFLKVPVHDALDLIKHDF